MDRARNVFEVVGHTLYLARTYHVISWAQLDERRFSDALDAVEKAWKYAELTASPYPQMTISRTFGRILFNTNQDTKAWKYIKISLINASYVGDRYQVAQALEYMGYGYLRRGDYQNAYGAYEAAAEKYTGTIFTRFAETFQDNLERIKQKQESPDAVIAFYRPSMDIDQTLFYSPQAGQAFKSEHLMRVSDFVSDL